MINSLTQTMRKPIPIARVRDVLADVINRATNTVDVFCNADIPFGGPDAGLHVTDILESTRPEVEVRCMLGVADGVVHDGPEMFIENSLRQFDNIVSSIKRRKVKVLPIGYWRGSHFVLVDRETAFFASMPFALFDGDWEFFITTEESDIESAKHPFDEMGVNWSSSYFEVLPQALSKRKGELLLQTVIQAGSRVPNGQLIEAVAIPWFEIIQALHTDPQLAFQLSPRKWEEMVAGAYKRAGFDEVILTPASGDLGRDVIAVKNGLGTVRVIDQVKAYKPGNLVTANDVRALLGILDSDGASKGFITTTSDFAPRLMDDRLITPFIPTRLEMINGEALLKNLFRIALESHT